MPRFATKKIIVLRITLETLLQGDFFERWPENMKKQFLSRLLCFALIVVSLISFIPIPLVEAAPLSDESTMIVPQITITPKFKGTPDPLYKSIVGGVTSSLATSVMLTSDDRISSGSFVGAEIKAEVLNGSGGHVSGYTAYLMSGTDFPYEVPNRKILDARASKFLSSSFSSKSLSFSDPISDLSEQVRYYSLYVFDSENQLVAKTTSSIAVSFFHKKSSNISWERLGMQARSVNGVPIGMYVYNKDRVPDSSPVPNTNAYKNIPYFYIKWDTIGETQVGQSLAITNLNELYDWLDKYVIPAFDAQGQSLDGAIEFGGPAIVKGKNNSAKGDILYVDAYYQSDRKTVVGEPEASKNAIGMKQTGKSNSDWTQNINTYASWGANTKTDLLRASYTSIVVNIQKAGKVRVLSYDEDAFLASNGASGLLKEEFVKLNDVAAVTGFDQLEELTGGVLNTYADKFLASGWANSADNKKASSATSAQRISEYMNANFGSLMSLYSSVTYDVASKKLVEGKMSEVLTTAMSLYNVRRDAITAVTRSADTKPYVASAKITPKVIPGYEFDFGYGLDMLTSDVMHFGAAISSHTNKDLNLVFCSANGEKIAYLFYRGSQGKYTVKYRINGEIDPSLTQTFTANIGDVIEDEDVPVISLPAGSTVTGYENVPLTVTSREEDNVIIVDIEGGIPYTVEYYKDTVKYKTENKVGVYGGYAEVSTAAPSGYTLDKVANYPLLLKEPGQIVRVYFVSTIKPSSPKIESARLYSNDDYAAKSLVTVTKSGYGVYAMLIVDYSSFYDGSAIKKSSHTPPAASSSCGGHSSQGTQTANKYRNIKVTATATFKDYYNGGKDYPNGVSRTVNMVLLKDDTSAHKAYFVLPKNAIGNGLSLQKAYIPINWKDGTDWSVDFNATVAYEEIEWTDVPNSGSHTYSCGGCRWSRTRGSYCRGHRCSYTTYSCTYDYNAKSAPLSASASVRINGNMYEDDFTGRGRR